jgi:hypothetical protein
MVYTDVQLARFLAKCRATNQDSSRDLPEAGSNGDSNPSHPDRAKHSDGTQELTPQARPAGRSGLLVAGRPRRASSKDSWREDARILEELYPEDFARERNQPSSASCVESSLCSGLVDSASREEPQCPPDAPESSPGALEVLPAPPAIPLLASAFWQGVLFGSPDALLSAGDVNIALRLVARELGKDSDVTQASESLRVKELRKMLDGWGADVWHVMNKLWRAAPASPGAPLPAPDQSQLPPGPREEGRNQPRWVRDLHDPDRVEREWLSGQGIGL